MGTIISQKVVKSTAIHNVQKMAWARYETVTISDVSDKVVLFEFKNEEDHKQIVNMSSWYVQADCLSMRKWMSSIGLANVDLKKSPILGASS